MAFLQLVVGDLTWIISWSAWVRLGLGVMAEGLFTHNAHYKAALDAGWPCGAVFIMCIMLNSFGLDWASGADKIWLMLAGMARFWLRGMVDYSYWVFRLKPTGLCGLSSNCGVKASIFSSRYLNASLIFSSSTLISLRSSLFSSKIAR